MFPDFSKHLSIFIILRSLNKGGGSRGNFRKYGEMRNAYKILSGKLEEENLAVHIKIIIKLSLRK